MNYLSVSVCTVPIAQGDVAADRLSGATRSR